MSTYKYERYISHVTKQPWAITPEVFATLIDLMRFRAAGHRLSDEEIQARVGDGRERRPGRTQGGHVAVIPIHGVIAHRADSFTASSGGASSEAIGRMFRSAMADDDVNAVLLDIDSPGGNVDGVPELASMIFEAKGRGTKRVVAHANALAASAAYWLATQADEFVVTPSGHVGSIGVYLLLEDLTAYLEKEGIKINAISAGENKLEGAPWEPLSDETRSHLQGQVDAVYKDFVAAVARGRRTSQANVRETFGQGRVFDAKQALKLGMVDRIETFDQTVDRLINKRVAVGSSGIRGELLADGTIAVPVVASWSQENESGGLDQLCATEATALFEANIDGSMTMKVVAGDAVLATGSIPAAETPEPAEQAIDPQIAADADYIDAGIRIAERL